MILSATVVAPAADAEDHREGPHTFEQQRGHGGPQVWCNSLFLAAQCSTSFVPFWLMTCVVYYIKGREWCSTPHLVVECRVGRPLSPMSPYACGTLHYVNNVGSMRAKLTFVFSLISPTTPILSEQMLQEQEAEQFYFLAVFVPK